MNLASRKWIAVAFHSALPQNDGAWFATWLRGSSEQTLYDVGSKSFRPTYKSRAERKMLRGIYSAIYGEVNVSVAICVEINEDYIEKYQNCFISVTFKSWLGRKLSDPPSYICFGNLRSVSGAETEIVTPGLGSRLCDFRKYHNMPLKLKSIPVCHINLRN